MSSDMKSDADKKYDEYLKRVAEIELANEDNRVCPSCEREISVLDGAELRVRPNPYEIEIHGVLKPMYSCYDCYVEVEQDI